MRAWLPERQVYGPEPAGERDTDALNRVFADAFTDRYRRDGLVGVRVPHLNPQVWRYALLDAGAGAMLWRDEGGHVVAFNVAHRSGTEGWMGPLAVRPDRQGAGVGKAIVRAAVDWLIDQGVATLGLETMPRTVENIGFYARLGFAPGHLTVTLTNDIATRGHAAPSLLSQRKGDAGSAALAAAPRLRLRLHARDRPHRGAGAGRHVARGRRRRARGVRPVALHPPRRRPAQGRGARAQARGARRPRFRGEHRGDGGRRRAGGDPARRGALPDALRRHRPPARRPPPPAPAG